MDCPNPPFAAVAHAIIRRLHAHPEGCSIRFRGVSISNAALLHTVLSLAEGLRASGIGPGTRAGVSLERSPLTPALLLALWWRGAVYVPLDPALPRERLFAMCEIAELDIVITQRELQPVIDVLPCPLLLVDTHAFDTEAHPLAPLPAPEVPLDAGTLAYILFTSGSSGMPKGVKIAHGNLAALFAGALPLLGLTPHCRILGCASFAFDIAFFELLAPLICGGTLVLADDATCAAPLQLLELIAREQVTVVQATPSHWQLLTALPWPAPTALALSTGEPLLRDTAANILRHADAVWNLYGPTECTIWASAHRVTAQDLFAAAPAIVSIGSALPGYTLHLEHTKTDDGTQAEELVIGGAGVGLGYCTDASTAFTMEPSTRSYHSGDLCQRDAQGRFHYSGRRDKQVKHNGYRIEPEEIALLLRQHKSIGQAVCLARPAGSHLPGLLFACVVFRRGMPNRDRKVLNEYLSTYLPDWMLPQRYFFLDELPLTANGKLDRSALFALTAPVETRSSQGTLEARVTEIFCEVLDVPGIGPCDSFLDTGGSSMLAATLVMTLNERLGGTLTLRQALATPPTVAGIVQLLRGGAPRQAS